MSFKTNTGIGYYQGRSQKGPGPLNQNVGPLSIEGAGPLQSKGRSQRGPAPFLKKVPSTGTAVLLFCTVPIAAFGILDGLLRIKVRAINFGEDLFF